MLEHETNNVLGLFVYDFDHHVVKDGFYFFLYVFHFLHGLCLLVDGLDGLGWLNGLVYFFVIVAAAPGPIHEESIKIIKIELLGFEPRTFCV